MAVRRPIKLDGNNNIRQCSDAEVTALVREAIRQYGLSPSVTLTVGSGNLGNLQGSRTRAGSAGSDATNFHTTNELGNVSNVFYYYNKVIQSVVSVSSLEAADDSWSFPLYLDGSQNLRSMTITDVMDTFVAPAVLLMCTTGTGTDQAGTYTVTSTTSAASGETLVSSTPIFSDWRANAAAYTAAGLPETRDQPINITNYYLHKISAAGAATIVRPLVYQLAATNKIQMYPYASLQAFLAHAIRYAVGTQALSGSTIRYSWSSTGTTSARGTAIVDTRLNSSAYLTNQVGDDYRAQEVPAGSAITFATHRLYIKRS
tara:strand:+ start:861 stop:1808 length:948 start_codon:yes stop_codon:yes gene_type:complete